MVCCAYISYLFQKGGGAIRMRIYVCFETLDFSYKFLYCMSNSVLYIDVKYTKYRDFFSLKKNVTWQLINIIVYALTSF